MDCDDPAIGQVAEGPSYWMGRGVSDHGPDESLAQGSHDLPAQQDHGAAVDGHPVGIHLVGGDPVSLRLEGASVGRIGIEGERALDRERGLRIHSSRRGKKRAGPDRRRAGDNPCTGQGSRIYLQRAGTCRRAKQVGGDQRALVESHSSGKAIRVG